ncbi:hypothetical protein Pcinc_002274 [Petrolisthes cinctipes]|uniref:Uncharacterized protein n=1 Tax=Petrolisthes cinctipes TaxID=88211 RepID=A0AAE1GLA5_PETCI|nr:hypothetical protein Pcinc_002274 [Petrolisthes cinctipes]
MHKKFEVINDHERAMTRAQLMEYVDDLEKTTIHNFKVKVKQSGKRSKEGYCKRRLPLESLDEAIYKRYIHESAECVPVHGIHI